MSRFSTNFGTYEIGAFPSDDFVNEWNVNESAAIVVDAPSHSGQAFIIPGENIISECQIDIVEYVVGWYLIPGENIISECQIDIVEYVVGWYLPDFTLDVIPVTQSEIDGV